MMRTEYRSNKIAVVVFATVIIFSGFSARSDAKPSIKTQTKYYSVQGTNFQELKQQMNRKGPSGYWAYARWDVRWTGKCKLSVTLKYTYPKWTNISAAPKSTQKAWKRMMTALKKHEQGHGQHGINAAREIEKHGCGKNSNAIISKWGRQDKKYDAQTRHGITQGVKLP